MGHEWHFFSYLSFSGATIYMLWLVGCCIFMAIYFVHTRDTSYLTTKGTRKRSQNNRGTSEWYVLSTSVSNWVLAAKSLARYFSKLPVSLDLEAVIMKKGSRKFYISWQFYFGAPRHILCISCFYKLLLHLEWPRFFPR